VPLSPGTRLGSYDIVSPLGAGGMSEVYRAQFPVFQRDSATPNVQDVPNVIVNWFEELNAVR
jgi:hypothetical protein